ncbi:unnamed protein product, partial [Amoebophrya sp. A25]
MSCRFYFQECFRVLKIFSRLVKMNPLEQERCVTQSLQDSRFASAVDRAGFISTSSSNSSKETDPSGGALQNNNMSNKQLQLQADDDDPPVPRPSRLPGASAPMQFQSALGTRASMAGSSPGGMRVSSIGLGAGGQRAFKSTIKIVDGVAQLVHDYGSTDASDQGTAPKRGGSIYGGGTGTTSPGNIIAGTRPGAKSVMIPPITASRNSGDGGQPQLGGGRSPPGTAAQKRVTIAGIGGVPGETTSTFHIPLPVNKKSLLTTAGLGGGGGQTAQTFSSTSGGGSAGSSTSYKGGPSTGEASSGNQPLSIATFGRAPTTGTDEDKDDVDINGPGGGRASSSRRGTKAGSAGASSTREMGGGRGALGAG